MIRDFGKFLMLEYLDIPSFCTGNRTGCIGVQNGKVFLSEPFGIGPIWPSENRPLRPCTRPDSWADLRRQS